MDTNGVEIYEGDITVTVTQAPSFYVSLNGSAPQLKGKLNMIVNGNIQTSYSVVPYFDSLNAEGGQWYITNATNDNDFVTLTSEKGKFAIKDGATAYSLKGKETVVKHEGGTVDLSAASGAYVISDKKDITPINNNPEKMLYYKLGGGHRHVAQWADPIEDEVTYIFEYTIFSQSYNLTAPIVYEDQRHAVTVPEVISDDVIGKAGLEQYYESYLRGSNGEQVVYVDTVGRISEIINYIQNGENIAKIKFQTMGFDEIGLKYTLSKYYGKMIYDFEYKSYSSYNKWSTWRRL